MASIQKLNDCREVLNELSVDLNLRNQRKQSFKSLKSARPIIDTGRGTSKSREKDRYEKFEKHRETF
jgi:hypothetical protein